MPLQLLKQFLDVVIWRIDAKMALESWLEVQSVKVVSVIESVNKSLQELRKYKTGFPSDGEIPVNEHFLMVMVSSLFGSFLKICPSLASENVFPSKFTEST
jgi:hypothetical protein